MIKTLVEKEHLYNCNGCSEKCKGFTNDDMVICSLDLTTYIDQYLSLDD